VAQGIRTRAATWVVNGTAWRLSRLACRVDDRELARIPPRGPLLLVANHVNFLEIPLVLSHLQPRRVTGLAKAETWDSPWMGILFNLWGAIPVRRGEGDVAAIRHVLEALDSGMIVAVAPEGTRSGDGCLHRAKPGIGLLAAHSSAPILPVAFFGHEHIWSNLKRLRRTDFHIRVGPLLRVRPNRRWTAEMRQAVADEIMLQIAALLPPSYRGEYAEVIPTPPRYLEPIPSSLSTQSATAGQPAQAGPPLAQH
jgi:1-acyl-sn-glycerol-3-phosphate acyltransferase